MIELPEFIQSKISPEPMSGCWLWTGALTPKGYAQIRMAKRIERGHRVVYSFYRGQLPDDVPLDHRCRTRCCVNPDHLEPVTFAENTYRGDGPAGKNRRKLVCDYGHSLEDAHVRQGRKGKMRRDCRECRKRSNRQGLILKMAREQ